jgi:two-component system, NtrC family, response regulator AtoC
MQAEGSVLLVDDDVAVGQVLAALVHQAGLEAHVVTSAKDALKVLSARPVDVVVTDLQMPEMDGMQLLEAIGAKWPEVRVLMITAHGTIALAVEAMKKGAADFMLKPFDREEVVFTIKKAIKAAKHSEESPTSAVGNLGGFVGASEAMKQIYALIAKVAAGLATVLIRGETGTGKELAARAIHAQSPRKSGPFIKVQLASLPDTLLESELFGYEKGAFTGAATRKPGRVELAQAGTLFLDEIGDVSPAMQVKLLRLLQEREFERLGGTQTLKADVRFVAATHRDLENMVAKGEFREDLFYRLNVVPVKLPPLRERSEDIEPLARHFGATLGPANGKPAMDLDAAAAQLLRSAPWPGNVRQLQNFVERLVVLSNGPTITAADVQRELPTHPGLSEPIGPSGSGETATLDAKRRDVEREAITAALRQARDNRTLAARLLGVSRRTLYNKLDELGLLEA